MVVITRYFGGTKLGVGGLIRAYGGTAGKALDQAERREVHETEVLEILFTYELTKAVDAVLRDHALTPVHTDFHSQVCMRLDVPVEALDTLRDALVQHTSGQVQFPSKSDP